MRTNIDKIHLLAHDDHTANVYVDRFPKSPSYYDGIAVLGVSSAAAGSVFATGVLTPQRGEHLGQSIR
jgi:hypothetical protein